MVTMAGGAGKTKTMVAMKGGVSGTEEFKQYMHS
jgi:hypothetical protein